MKKIYTLFLSLLCVFVLFGCWDTNKPKVNGGKSDPNHIEDYFVAQFDYTDPSQVVGGDKKGGLLADKPEGVVLEYRTVGDNAWKTYKLNFSPIVSDEDVDLPKELKVAGFDIEEIAKNGGTNIKPFELRIKGISAVRFFEINNDDDFVVNIPVTVKSWGKKNKWITTEKMFESLKKLTITATDIPDLSNCLSMEDMFSGSGVKHIPNIEMWNTSSVMNMESLFCDVEEFNQDISKWNTASVTDMSEMFKGAKSFNQDIGKWNTSNVTDMSDMFENANKFNQNIGNWDISKVTEMNGMFLGAESFNQDISKWNTSNVTDMAWMFLGAKVFNQNIGNWDTSKVIKMNGMFSGAESFNQNIGSWNTANVVYMNEMFSGADAFNQDISKWNVNKVSDFDNVFFECPIKSEFKPEKFR